MLRCPRAAHIGRRFLFRCSEAECGFTIRDVSTLREYFDTDFPYCLSTSQSWPAKAAGADIKIISRVHLDFDAGVTFISYYIPPSVVPKDLSVLLLGKVEDALSNILQSVEVQMGYEGEQRLVSTELKFSGRVFIYTESPVLSEDLLDISNCAKSLSLSVVLRGPSMAASRAAIEKPLAFISHDWRDKDEIARPLAVALSKLRCPVWYDEFSLRIGDSLRMSIERGIRECQKCVLVLTQNFLSNTGWTRVEFDSIFTREIIETQKVILPVWSGVTKTDIYKYSPSLADRFAAQWGAGVDEVSRQLYRAITDRRGRWITVDQ